MLRKLKLRFSLPFILYGMISTVVGIVAYNKVQETVEYPVGRWAAYGILAALGVFYPLAKAVMSKVMEGET